MKMVKGALNKVADKLLSKENITEFSIMLMGIIIILVLIRSKVKKLLG